MGLSPRGGPTGEVERGPRHAQGHPQPLHCSLSGCGACVLGRAQTGGPVSTLEAPVGRGCSRLRLRHLWGLCMCGPTGCPSR